MSFYLLNANVTDLAAEGALMNGVLQVKPAAWWRQYSQEAISVFCVKHGIYSIPTQELIERIRNLIDTREAIEVGAGHGAFGAALGIPATDNKMQTWPAVAEHYRSLGQATVPYGSNVLQYDAVDAVRTFRPDVVFATWLTHRYDPTRPELGGNEHGVIERQFLSIADYIFVGNTRVHAAKFKLMPKPDLLEHPDYLVSRAMNGTPDFLAVWKRTENTDGK